MGLMLVREEMLGKLPCGILLALALTNGKIDSAESRIADGL